MKKSTMVLLIAVFACTGCKNEETTSANTVSKDVPTALVGVTPKAEEKQKEDAPKEATAEKAADTPCPYAAKHGDKAECPHKGGAECPCKGGAKDGNCPHASKHGDKANRPCKRGATDGKPCPHASEHK